MFHVAVDVDLLKGKIEMLSLVYILPAVPEEHYLGDSAITVFQTSFR